MFGFPKTTRRRGGEDGGEDDPMGVGERVSRGNSGSCAASVNANPMRFLRRAAEGEAGDASRASSSVSSSRFFRLDRFFFLDLFSICQGVLKT